MNTKRVSIKKRLLSGILGISIILLLIAIVTGMVFMGRITNGAERLLSDELSRNLSSIVEQKAEMTDVMFDKYEGIITFIHDYIEGMYLSRDALIPTGKYVDSPRATTGKDEYAMQSGFSQGDIDLDDYMDDIYFFSHLENIMDSISKENEDVITTIYLGARDGYMFSYDKWSWLSAVPEPENMVYDFTQSEWYKKGMEESGVFYTGLYVDSMGRGLTVTIGSQFKDDKGEIAGVVAADFDITAIYDEMISMDLGEGASSLAIDKNGKIVSIDSDEEVLAKNYLDLDDTEIARLTSGGPGLLETREAFYAYAPVADLEWTLCAAVPQSLVLEKVTVLRATSRIAQGIFGMIAALLIIAGVYFSGVVTRSIIHPIELLGKDMNSIANGDLEHRAIAYRNDEIGDLTLHLNEMVGRLKATMNGLANAQGRAEKMHELANKDALTGVRNKTAYDRYLGQLARDYNSGEDKFGFIMIDLNDLKRINDTYGHEKGDVALKKLCGIICEVFKHSPVFRVGGDEFVVVLREVDYDDSDALIGHFRQIIDSLRTDETLDPWQRTSAAIGCALYDKNQDESVAAVFRRADAAMYEMKKKMKIER